MGENEFKSLDVDVINFIIKNNKASIDELSKYFNSSQVSIRNVLARIENFVSKNNLGVLLKDNSKYFFKDNYLNLNFDYEKHLIYDLEKKERINYLFFKIFFENHLNLTKISKTLKISRITLNGDLEIMKNILNEFKLDLVSVQWKGIFLKGDPVLLEKLPILFLTKLYLEGYFTSDFKKIVNPLMLDFLRSYIDEETENKITKLTDKIYSHFNIGLGTTYYFILKSIILVYYHKLKKDKYIFPFGDYKPKFDLREEIYHIISEEEKELIGENIIPIVAFLSFCVGEKYAPIYSFDMKSILKDIFETYGISRNEKTINEIGLFINSIYYQNKFSIQSYCCIKERDKKYIETEISQKFISILKKYNIPFKEENIIFMYCYITNLIIESQKKNVLIINNGSFNWEGKELKERIKHLETLNEIDIISYFNFKFFSEEYHQRNKYKIYVFIDLPFEKFNFYKDKKCIFINSYDLIVNFAEIIKLFLN